MSGGGKNKDPKLEGAGKLIGGYASNNLSEQEKEALFGAALHDQDVFDALMEEQALKDLLEEPGIKAELIQTLQPKVTLFGRIRDFLATPAAWGTLGAVATAAVLLVVIVPSARRSPQVAHVRMEAEPSRQEEAKPRAVGPAPATAQAPPLARRADRQPVPAPPAEPLVDRALEKREQAADVAKERDRLPLAAPPRVQGQPQQQEPLQVQQPVPASAASSVRPMLALDYALVRRAADGSYQTATAVRLTDEVRLQVMPSETGYVSLYRRSADGLMTAVTAGKPVARGQVVQIPEQGSLTVSDGNYVLVLSRDSGLPAGGAASTAQGFRQSRDQAKMKRSAPSSAATGAMLDSSLRKAVLPAVSLGRVTAESPDSRSVAVDITIRGEGN